MVRYDITAAGGATWLARFDTTFEASSLVLLDDVAQVYFGLELVVSGFVAAD